jgi:TRAP-type transport system periplasmic protein
MKRLFFILIAIVAVVTIFLLPVQAKMVMKAGHISPKMSIEGKAADKFAELVAQKTNGEIVVEVFPSEQLGKAPTMIDSTILGNQDIYIGGNVEFEKFSPGLRVVGLNYTMRDQDHFRKVLKSEVWKKIFTDPLEKVGFKTISTEFNWERGPFRVLVSKKPVNKLEDLNGLRLRIAPLDTWKRSWSALGCNVVVLPWTDVYLGLTQGVVDSVTSPFDLLYSMKFTEVAKYVARTDEYWGLVVVGMNVGKFNALKPEWQKALIDASNEAGLYHRQLSEVAVKEDLEKMKKDHGITYTVLDLKPFVAKMQPVIRQFEQEGFLPKGVYDEVQAVK